jgi:UDPglucose 6-dehydrogenase
MVLFDFTHKPKEIKMQVGVIGLGKLGLPLALCLAEVGYQVIGFDKNFALINSLNNKTFFTHEPYVMEFLEDPNVQEKIEYSESATTLRNCKIIYIIVPTPSDSKGGFDSEYVEKAIEELMKVWNSTHEEKTVVIVSTVMPGTCQIIARKQLEGSDVNLLYSPEFIALGTVVNNLKKPDAILVGCSREADSKTHVEIQRRLSGDIPVSILSWEEAEVVKLLVNCYVTMKISFANFIGEICDVLPGANPKKIAGALGIDSRIGGKYLNPGLGYAGPCFPRDNRALSTWSLEMGLNADLAIATQSINSRQPSVTLERVMKLLAKESFVLIIGLVYKPKTEVLEQSQSLELARNLKTKGHFVSIFDPFVSLKDKSDLKSDFQFLDTLSECKGFELIVISPGFETYTQDISPDQKIYRF